MLTQTQGVEDGLEPAAGGGQGESRLAAQRRRRRQPAATAAGRAAAATDRRHATSACHLHEAGEAALQGCRGAAQVQGRVCRRDRPPRRPCQRKASPASSSRPHPRPFRAATRVLTTTKATLLLCHRAPPSSRHDAVLGDQGRDAAPLHASLLDRAPCREACKRAWLLNGAQERVPTAKNAAIALLLQGRALPPPAHAAQFACFPCPAANTARARVFRLIQGWMGGTYSGGRVQLDESSANERMPLGSARALLPAGGTVVALPPQVEGTSEA